MVVFAPPNQEFPEFPTINSFWLSLGCAELAVCSSLPLERPPAAVRLFVLPSKGVGSCLGGPCFGGYVKLVFLLFS